MTPALRAVAILFFAWAFVGCVSKPTMHLNHAEISGVQLATMPPSFGIVLTVVIDVFNPNGYDVAVRAVRGQTVMSERYVLPVDYRAPGDGVWLPAGQTTSVRVPIVVPFDVALSLLRDAYSVPVVPYRFTGGADVTASRTFQLEKDNYSVDERGSITRQQIEAVIPNSFMPR